MSLSASFSRTCCPIYHHPPLHSAFSPPNTLLAVHFIPVPGGSLRVRCQRPGCSQTHNEYEMILGDCGKLSRVVCKQSWLLCIEWDQTETGSLAEDVQCGHLMLPQKHVSINQDIQKRALPPSLYVPLRPVKKHPHQVLLEQWGWVRRAPFINHSKIIWHTETLLS